MPNTPIYNIEDTWDNESAVFDAIKINVTDTASDPFSKLLDLKVGGISQFKVDKAGNVTASGTIAGLDQVDNTSDADKPVSTLQQAAIDAVAAGGGAFDADANTLITPSTPIVLGQATGDEAALTLDYTTNKATSGNDTGLLINMTDTLSPGTSSLMDLQVGGVSKAAWRASDGSIFMGSSINPSVAVGGYGIHGSVGSSLHVGSVNGNAYIGNTTTFGGTALIGAANNGVSVWNTGSFSWSSAGNSYGSRDLFLTRDAANTLGQRNGVNAQISNIYNTDDGAGNAEWLSLGFSSGGDATIQAAKSGTGLSRPLFVRGQTLFLGGAVGANHWKISTAGHFLAQADNTYDIGAASANRPRNGYFSGTLDIDQGTLTDDAQALNITSTWNDAADTFTLIKADVTNTASAAGSKLLDLQVGGTSYAFVNNGGIGHFGAGIDNAVRLGFNSNPPGGSYGMGLWATGAGRLWLKGYSNIYLGSGGSIGTTGSTFGFSGTTQGTLDVLLGRDAANTLAQRNGVNAQTSNIYNTYTDATNYERAHIGWNDTADTFVIGTEAGSGGGAVRDMSINADVVSLQGGQPGNELLRLCHIGAAINQHAKAYITYYRGASTSRLGYSGFSGENTYEIGTSFAAGQFRLRIANDVEALLVDSAGDATFAKSVSMQSQDIAQGTLTDDAQALNITSTWNDAADTFTLIKADVTNTASAADSKLLDLQVGGASKFSVDAGGEVFGSGVNSRLRLTDSVGAELEYSNWRIGIGGPIAYFYQTTIAKVGMGADGLRLADSGALRWSSGSQASTGHDLLLTRDSAATLQLGENHGTTPTGQTIKAHDVVTGTGADLTLSGGLGSVANGDIVLQPTSGNVGIGTTTPNASALLHVKGGDARFTSANDIGILIKPTNSSTSFRSTHANDDIIIETGKDFIIETWGGSNYVEKVRVLASGSVGIGTATPDANAILDVSSTTKAFLPPRMTTTEKNAVASPAAGMLVYDSTLNKLAVYTGAAWEAITSA